MQTFADILGVLFWLAIPIAIAVWLAWLSRRPSRTCPTCSAQISLKAKRCPACGAVLDDVPGDSNEPASEAAAASESDSSDGQKPGQQAPGKKKRKKQKLS